MKAFKKLYFILIVIPVFLLSQEHPNLKHFPLYPDGKVKNVILMIGDGMGIGQFSSVRLKRLGKDGQLTIEKLPVSGIVRTHSADRYVTDSAAGATAMATGYKTNNGMISTLPDSSRPLTILEAFKSEGYGTGIVSTSAVTHATPACFVAHTESRKQQNLIASQILKTRPDVVLGGGKGYFIPSGEKESLRKDNLNLLEKAREVGYATLFSKDDLQKADSDKLLGLFSKNGLVRAESEPTLSEMTQKALEVLGKNSKGFFLMVEGSQIDWASHENDFDYLQKEMLGFDLAVAVAVDFALKNGETLIIITADHETGGLTIIDDDEHNLKFAWSTHHHSATPVALFAFGPYAYKFTGMIDNTDIPRKISEIVGLKNFPAKLSE